MNIAAQSIWRDEDGNEVRVVAVVDALRQAEEPAALAPSIQTDPAWFKVWTEVA